MRSEPARRPKPDHPEALAGRIAELTVRILSKAALDAHGHDHIDEAWVAFKQH